MTVEPLKAAAANLPSDDRLEFADWLAQDQGVQHARNDRLRRALQHGVDQIDRGECVKCRNDAEIDALFSEIERRAMERVGASRQASGE
jgi:hypothetical protein